MKKKFTQTDVNLAVNYSTLERVTNCMGIYEQLIDEHEELPIIFDKAAKGTLSDEFSDLKAQSEEGFEAFIEKLQGIFGLDSETLTGKKQINLGIGVNPKVDTNFLENYSMYELYDYIKVEEAKHNLPQGTLKTVLEKRLALSDKLVDEWILQQDETAHTNLYLDFNTVVKLWKSNPLKLNIPGLYVYLIEQKILNKKKFKSIYSSSFEEMIVVKTDEDDTDDTEDKNNSRVPGKQNIYCLDSIIYYILRADKYFLYERKAKGEAKHKLLDNCGGIVPYPLCYIKPEKDELTLFDVIDHLKSLGFIYSYAYSSLVEYSTIQEEIEHYNEDVLPHLKAKCETLIEIIKQDSEQGINADLEERREARLEKVQDELNYIIGTYLPALEASQAMFDRDPQAWIKNQQAVIQQADRYQHLKARRAKLMKIEGIEEALKKREIDVDPGILDKVRELKVVNIRIAEIKSVCKEIKKKAHNKRYGGPWIRVREPYYRYIPLEFRTKKEK